jgi:CRISPR-associated endonuclease Csn1
MIRLSIDVGTNSVGSAWIDDEHGQITTGTSIFPAGVDESDEKRGDPKNAKRRMTRRSRITLARRSSRKRDLRLRLIAEGLLPQAEPEFVALLETTDPWELRRRGLESPLSPHEFGRLLLHMAQRRGALGLLVTPDAEGDDDAEEDGKVKRAIGEVRAKMLTRGARTFGEFICMVRKERTTALTSPDNRRVNARFGKRQYSSAVRNKAGRYEHCADRAMIRHEFSLLWDAQKSFGGELAARLTDELRLALDDESGDSIWRHKGLLFGQRRQTWDLGTLGRCSLEPTERCVPHADMYASRYLVVETINNLRIIERGKEPRSLNAEERTRLSDFLSGPLGIEKPRKTKKGTGEARPKSSVTVTDLRNVMGWGRATKNSEFHFNVERDEDRAINTDWFSREIIHGAVTQPKWQTQSEAVKLGLNRALLRFNPEEESHAARLKVGAMSWAGLTEQQADALVAAWRARPKLDAKRLSLSRKAVRNLLAVMDRELAWPDPRRPGESRWVTAIEARKMIADDAGFLDRTTNIPLDATARFRYANGSGGATARDRHYMRKHVLLRNGKPILGDDGKPLAEPAPAPLISNPVVRKAIHEVRRHLVEYMTRFGKKPDQIYVELAREARMGAKDADRLLFRNRLRNRIQADVVAELLLDSLSATQRRAATTRVLLAVQQQGVCPLCGNMAVPTALTPRLAAAGTDCEVAHIIPRGSGGHNGLANIVLAHTKCNRDMARRTPRDFWNASMPGGYDAGISLVEKVYGEIDRPKLSEVKNATGVPLWLCYFNRRDDAVKIDQFKKSVSDIQEMTARQDAATKYAARQLMGYLADAVLDGTGLPERGGTRRIFATDGLWTSRLRREWELFFDPHDARAHGLEFAETEVRREKNRGDHRHHAIDAVVIAYCTATVQQQWDDRERRAAKELPNSADEAVMENFRRLNPLPPPAPFKSVEEFRMAVRFTVFGKEGEEKPVCHRAVKRKLIGAFHEETLFGPVLDSTGAFSDLFTSRKAVVALKPNHLRLPRPESEKEAIARLTARRAGEKAIPKSEARSWAKAFVASAAYTPLLIDPPPEKSGIVRDLGLRKAIRRCIEAAGLDPDNFTAQQIKRLAEAGGVRHTSGVPIRSAVLLRTMSEPVIIPRRRQDYAEGHYLRNDDPASHRAYLGGNNHHIEIRIDDDGKLTGVIITAFETAQRKLAKLNAFRKADIPKPADLRELPRAERARLRPSIRRVELDHPIVDRRDDDSRGGRFVMSLCEGEMLYVRQKWRDGEIGAPSYFVVAKLDKPNMIVLVPHWDARAAGGRKDCEGKSVPNSQREQFSATPSDLKILAPDGEELAVKVRVSALGSIDRLTRD